ncbi:MAG: agmatinase [Cyanobacteria bacterium]|nr:agmatinase [Cyanobacteriota bacterium]
MGACQDFNQADWVMVGLPYDGTCSYRPGSRFAPELIRQASWGLESYSARQDKDFASVSFFDAGDLELPFGNRDASLALIQKAAKETLAANKRWLGIGGEHLVTFPVIQAYIEKYPDLAIVHFDAHGDMREDYLGERLSHATVLRRIAELTGPERILQIGIRSAPADEFAWMRAHETLVTDAADWQRKKHRVEGRPVFITVDLDVLDPSVLPGTGTPEPGGLGFSELINWFDLLKPLNRVGMDVVELAPHYDASGVSTAVATKVIRELLLL